MYPIMGGEMWTRGMITCMDLIGTLSFFEIVPINYMVKLLLVYCVNN
jgi:hypothetical protein